jgi:hypothetical protein
MKKDCFHYKRLIEGKWHSVPKQRSSSDKTSPKDAGEKRNFSANRTGVSRKAGEAGIFVEAIMNGFRVKLLVDTGATLYIISPDVLYSILNDPKPTLAQIDQPILMTDRTALKVEGSISIPLTVSNLVFNQTFAVAHTGIDGILGLDFMTNNDCLIDLPNSSMMLKGKWVKLSFEGEIGCRRSQLGLTGEPIKLDGISEKAKESTPYSSKSNAEQTGKEFLKQDYEKDDTRDGQPRKEKRCYREQRDRVIRKQKAPAKPYTPQTKSSLSKSRPKVSKDTQHDCRKRRACIVDVTVQTEENKVNQEMVRQKHYHDRKSKWKKFDHDEEMNVCFPWKHWTSSKLKSFWQGPYLVKTLSGWTYLGNCGQRSLSQDIRVDRMDQECN